MIDLAGTSIVCNGIPLIARLEISPTTSACIVLTSPLQRRYIGLTSACRQLVYPGAHCPSLAYMVRGSWLFLVYEVISVYGQQIPCWTCTLICKVNASQVIKPRIKYSNRCLASIIWKGSIEHLKLPTQEVINLAKPFTLLSAFPVSEVFSTVPRHVLFAFRDRFLSSNNVGFFGSVFVKLSTLIR